MPLMTDKTWQVPLTAVSLDKKQNRANVQRGFCSELVGIDGRIQGGLRPHPGFKLKRKLADSANTYASGGSITSGHFTPPSGSRPDEVFDVFPFTVQVGTGNRATGWVVRDQVNGSSGIPNRVFIEWFYTADGVLANGKWYYKQIIASYGTEATDRANGKIAVAGGATWAVATADKQMSVTVYGRILYIHQQGQPTIRCVMDTTIDDNFLEVQGTGPGASSDYPLVLERVDFTITAGTASESSTDGSDGDDVALGEGTSIRVVDLGSLETPTDNICDDTADARKSRPFYNEADKGRWASASQQHIQAQAWTGSTGLGAESAADRRLITKRFAKLGMLARGDYAFAYQLYNSNIGTYSALSVLANKRAEDYPSRGAPRAFAFEIPSSNLSTFTTAGWTHVILYRSLNALDAGGANRGAVLRQEGLFSLSTTGATGYIPASGQGSGDFIYWFTLRDNALAQKRVYDATSEFDARMPFAGAAVVYDGVLVCSNIDKNANDSVTTEYATATGVGEIRWSSVGRKSVELFDPENRYLPASPGDGMTKLMQVGDRVIGVGPSRWAMIFKAGLYLTIREMHDSYGSVGNKAATNVGNMVWAVTPKGVVMVDVEGALQGVRGLDYLIMEEWKNNLSAIEMIYDGRYGYVQILNKTLNKSVIIWLTTSMISMLEGCTFATMAEGYEPNSSDGSKTAFFVMDDGRVYMFDGTRSRDVQSMLEAGDANETYYNTTVTGENEGVIGVTGIAVDADLFNCYVHFVTGAEAGNSYRIVGVDTNQITVDGDLSGVVSGDVIAINAVKVRIGTENLGFQDENVQEFPPPAQFFRQRTVTAMGLHLDNVTFAEGSAPVSAKFRAFLWRGLDDTELGGSVPLGTAGGSIASLVEGPGPNYAKIGNHGIRGAILFPVVEIACAGVDFVAFSLIVKGQVEESTRLGAGS